MTIPPHVIEGWQNILKDVEAVVEGKLLIPHPLLPEGYGIGLPSYVDNPAPLDLVVGYLRSTSTLMLPKARSRPCKTGEHSKG